MTFEEWIATQDNCQPADWSSLPSAYRFWIKIARAAWEEGYDQGVADSDPAVEHYDPPIKGPLSALDGLPGMDGYTYDQFSKDSDRW